MEGCETCRGVSLLLSSYIEGLESTRRYEVQKEDVWTLLEFTNAWSQRQCSCIFKDYKNFERLNSLVQLILRVAIDVIGSPRPDVAAPPTAPSDTASTSGDKSPNEDSESDDKAKDKKLDGEDDSHQNENVKNDAKVEPDEKKDEDKEDKENKEPVAEDDSKDTKDKSAQDENSNSKQKPEDDSEQEKKTDDSKEDIKESSKEKEKVEDEEGGLRWTTDEEEKLLHLVAKAFQLNFPLYAAHKQFYHGVTEEMSSQETEALGNYCDMNDLDVPMYLLRNVCFFCDSNGLAVMRQCFENCDPDKLPFALAHAMIAIVANLRLWLHLHAVMQYVAPLRSHVIRYLCKLSDKELRRTSARDMAEMMWSAIKEPMEAPLSFDKDSLELAYKYFVSSTLTMRLTGLSQITSQIHMFNEVYNNESVADIDNVGTQLTTWLLDKEIVEHMFGPNIHIEIIKQCQIILNFLAAEGALTPMHVDSIWAAAKLKHSGRYVHDLFPHLIKHLEAELLFHLLKLVSRLHPSEHTEQSLYLSQVITKCIWTNALSTSAVSATTHKRPVHPQPQEFPLLRSNLEGTADKSGYALANTNNSRAIELYELEKGAAGQHPPVMMGDCAHCSHEDEAIDVVAVGSGSEGAHIRTIRPKHDHCGPHYETPSEDSSPSARRKARRRLRRRRHDTPDGTESSSEDDSDKWDSENEGLVTSPDNTDSGSDESEDSEEERIAQLGSEYEDVSEEESDVEMPSDHEEEEEEEEEDTEDMFQNAPRRPVRHRRRPSEGDESSSRDESFEERFVRKPKLSPVKRLKRQALKQVCDPHKGELRKEPLPRIDEDEGAAALTSPMEKPKAAVEVVRTDEVMLDRLPSSPASDHLSSQEAHRSDDFFLGESSMETEIYDCRRFLPHPHGLGGNVMDDLLSAEEASCSSSQASAKSEKNMADFDGEEEDESGCEDELAQLSAHLSQLHQHRHHHHHHTRAHPHLSDITSVYRNRLSSSCSHGDKDDQTSHFRDFRFEDVCRKNRTLLWDLVQDENAVHLGEGLTAEAEKLLCSLVCWFPEREIRMKFVEGCLENLKHHRSIVVSLRLLPKLFGSFQQYRNNYNTHWITMWAEEELHMMECFFNNLVHYTNLIASGEKLDKGLYTHTTEVQARLQFLTCVFSTLGSPDHFRLSLDQVDTLWACLAKDAECSDDALSWFLNQAGNKDQHALGLETFKHIFFNKMPQLEPEKISMTGLNLFQQLCSLARLASSSSYDSPPIEMPGIDHLWKIALRARNTDVSLSAIQYINSYYVNAGNGSLEKEEEFISRCMSSLSLASESLDTSQDSSMLVLQRGLILLKTHLEAFRKRYAYHLRQWQLEGKGITSHQKHTIEGHAQVIRVVCQLAGMSDKFTLELSTSDLIADLRAEVTHFSERFQQQQIQDSHDQGQQQQPKSPGNIPFKSVLPNIAVLAGCSQGPVRMISAGHELTPDLDEKTLKEMGFSDLQLVFVSFGALRRDRKRDGMDQPASCLPAPPQDKLPMMLLLQEPHFNCLFNLLQQLYDIKSDNMDDEARLELQSRAQMLSRNVWDLLMLLPTNSDLLKKFKALTPSQEPMETSDKKDAGENKTSDEGESSSKKSLVATELPDPPRVDWANLLDEKQTNKLLYSLQIVEALGQPSKKRRTKSLACVSGLDRSPSITNSEFGVIDLKSIPSKSDSCLFSTASDEAAQESWNIMFINSGGLKHLVNIFMSGNLEANPGHQWSVWQQDSLACILKLINEFALEQAQLEMGQDDVFDEQSTSDGVPSKKPRKARRSSGEASVTRLSKTLLELLSQDGVLQRLMSVLSRLLLGDTTHMQAGYWVVHYGMQLLTSWAFSDADVKIQLCQSKIFDKWLQRLVLKTSELFIRREVCEGLFRMCEGSSLSCQRFSWALLSSLLSFLSVAHSIVPKKQDYDRGCDDNGPGCRNYFLLLCSIVDNIGRHRELQADGASIPVMQIEKKVVNMNSIAKHLAECIKSRSVFEKRHNTVEDMALSGLLKLCTAVMKHNPPYKFSKDGQVFLSKVFECLFAVPSIDQRTLPMCKSKSSRIAAFDLLIELARGCLDNYIRLHTLMLEQHLPGTHQAYPWQYWPQDDGRSCCGYVGLTNLGATCYMASCMQQLYMMPEARVPILNAKVDETIKYNNILTEMQRMFAFLQESERKAYNPRSFCKVYTMDKQPLNTGEQKDMTEFFTDLISKMEEMTPELRDVVSSLFKGELTNNVVSLDCPHVSQTTEEFFTVRCQVADMKNLYESLDEVTVKDTLEGDNMYTCSQCGKKVRAEKRACFKTLPEILSFNTMRYTFNMVTMMKEKVNTHFSFPVQLDMSGYTEEALMGDTHAEATSSKSEDQSQYLYDLIGVTVHTGTADGGHYYSFIKDRTHSSEDQNRWYMFNDAEVKPFDSAQLAAECFGGEMTTKTYDSVTDKYMDFSFEKTHSAYMLFYQRCEPGDTKPKVPQEQTVELSKELAEWIWCDNMHYLRDRYIFDHNYMHFMWQVCSYLPSTLPEPPQVQLHASKLTTSFVLETLIHAREKPTMLQWMELMTKQFRTCQAACEWFLDYMSKDDWWPQQILIKCPIQTIRQLFQRLCVHVIRQLREKHAPLYLHPIVDGEEVEDLPSEEIGDFSCVTRFIKKLLTVLEHGVRPQCKHLTEYFSVLIDFAKIGDDEAQFLTSVEAISIMANFYLGTKAADYQTADVSDDDNEDDDDEDDIISLTEEKYRPTSLEKMIQLIAYLVESSRTERQLMLSQNDYAVLVAGKGFPFLFQQIRDSINLQQTRNLIFSLTRFNSRLAEQIIAMIFNAIAKLSPEAGQPFFKVLSMLVDIVGGPPGLPGFTPIILQRIWEVSEYNPQQVLDWLATQTPRNKLVHHWVLQGVETWVEHFLLMHHNVRVRNAAAFLLISLVPDGHFRQSFRSARSVHSPQKELRLSQESILILQQIYALLLRLLARAKPYVDASAHGTTKLVAFFSVLSHCLISRQEKRMFTHFFMDLWNLYQPKLSEPPIACNHNKQALLQFWYNACVDYPDNIELIVSNPTVAKHIPYNYILADHDDQEVVMFNRVMLPAYYGLLRLCCQQSTQFARQLATHQNMQWAFRYLTPHASQYPMVVDELFRMMKLFVMRVPDISSDEMTHIQEFKRITLHCYLECLERSSCWTTLISAFRILLEDDADRLVVVCNHGLSRLADAFNTLHMMYHEATACHVTGDLVELLSITLLVLRCASKHKDCKEVKQSLLQWQERMEFAHKLLTLLNSFTPDLVRTESLALLHELVNLYPKECVQRLVPLITHAHHQFLQSNIPVTCGPFFPRRMPKPAPSKSGIRPPRPELQMFLHANQLETSHGTDSDYDKALREFFHPYHHLIETLCHTALTHGMFTEETVSLSVLVAVEGVPLQFDWFAKLWKTIYKSEGSEKSGVQLLCSMQSFHDYIEGTLIDERTAFNNPNINSFFCMFFPKVYKHVLNSNWDQVVNTVVNTVISESADIDTYISEQLNMAAVKLNGDLRALLLMFSVVPPRQLSANLLPALHAIQKACHRHRQAKAAAQERRLAAAAAAAVAAAATAASKQEASEEKTAAGSKSTGKVKVTEKEADAEVPRKKMKMTEEKADATASSASSSNSSSPKSGESNKSADMPSLKVGNSPSNEDSKSDKDASEDSSKDKDKQSVSDEDIVPHSPKTKPENGPSTSSTKDKTEASGASAGETKGTDSTPDVPSTSAGPPGKKVGGKQQARQQDSVDVLIKSIDTLMVFFKQQLKGTEET
ncbi:LOW QUALITY PROTEIN: ubiquitin carboxyl-terminal hydrolase 34-like [Amphiura filiformis]|uniref:LOW QUALITY PROTEIN: ubiquitin carboxyl-terminal hydrolase 34-like n=1 Tax=Amphiura filiformis TaxID=82378 RepID=UPI003B21B07A